MNRVMLDIETLGLNPGAAILSIGAVKFDTAGLGDTFYRSVSLPSCQNAGLTIDAGTLDWWLTQDDTVKSVLSGGDPLSRVLLHFSNFYGDADEIWAFSPSFDCAILSAAYDAVDETAPWSYRDERDARTVASLPNAVEIEQDGEEHDALDDARHQARMVAATLRNQNTELEKL